MERNTENDLSARMYNAPILQESSNRQNYAQRFYEREQKSPYLRRAFWLEIGIAYLVIGTLIGIFCGGGGGGAGSHEDRGGTGGA